MLTAADRRYWRCLYQFLLGAERRKLHTAHGFVAYDLGLGAERRGLLEKRFAWCRFRPFDFAAYPPHIGRDLRDTAWKPMLIAQAMECDGGILLWLDSATVIKAPLDEVIGEIRRRGVYALKGQAALGRRCDRAVLDRLEFPLELRSLPEHVSGVLGLDTAKPAARRLVDAWRGLALVEEHLGRRRFDGSHMVDQALLSVALYRMQAAGEITLGYEEIDISSASPVRWMSSRNKVPEWLPRWLDPAARAYYATYKVLDRAWIRLERWYSRRVNGLLRRPKENFSVFVSSIASGEVAAVAAPRLCYYADPFLWTRNGRTCLFVEEFDFREHRGRLCCMDLDASLRAAAPAPIPLDYRHVSFPFLFEHDGTLYMLPETCSGECVDLFSCEEFPHRWTLVRRLLYGVDAADSTLVRHEGRWWLFTSVRECGDGARHLEIFHATDLLHGEWRPHPVNERRLHGACAQTSGRNAGAPLRSGGLLLRPVQKDSGYYGEGTLWMQIDTLTERDFSETPYTGSHPMALLAGRTAPHHQDRHGDLVAWDVRDRVGYWHHVPLLRRWFGPQLAPGARASSGFAARGLLPQDIAAEFRCSG